MSTVRVHKSFTWYFFVSYHPVGRFFGHCCKNVINWVYQQSVFDFLQLLFVTPEYLFASLLRD